MHNYAILMASIISSWLHLMNKIAILSFVISVIFVAYTDNMIISTDNNY